MRILHFDIISGIAGDMTMAALSHLGAPIEPLQEALLHMGLQNVIVKTQEVRTSGIASFRFVVTTKKEEHHHRSFEDVLTLLDLARLDDGARVRAESIFERLAKAEASVHGIPKEQVTFHEVGAVDSIADVVGCALALEHLAPERVTSSRPVVGSGVTPSQHGPLPVPAPATLEVLKGISIRSLPVEQELTTPTGAAILASQVDAFGDWPAMKAIGIGYGAGSREIPDRPNLLRAILGEAGNDHLQAELLIETNIDDMSPEHFEHLMDRLLGAGAHDVWLHPIQMKKNRPAVTLGMLCDEAKLETLEHILFVESTTIGLRRQIVTRRKLTRRHETVTTPWGPIRLKLAGEGTEIYTAAPEYEDCRALAERTGVALREIFAAAEAAWRNRSEGES